MEGTGVLPAEDIVATAMDIIVAKLRNLQVRSPRPARRDDRAVRAGRAMRAGAACSAGAPGRRAAECCAGWDGARASAAGINSLVGPPCQCDDCKCKIGALR